MHAAVLLPCHQAGLFQHAQMLRYGGERHLVWRRQFADGCFTLAGEAREDAATSGMRQGGEGGIERRA